MDHIVINQKLNACLLTDEEFEQGPDVWLEYEDNWDDWGDEVEDDGDDDENEEEEGGDDDSLKQEQNECPKSDIGDTS